MLHEPDRGPKRPTMRVPGIYAGDMNTTRQTSVKDCRLSASKRPQVRSATIVKPCGGYVHEAQGKIRPLSKNAIRKHKRYGKAL